MQPKETGVNGDGCASTCPRTFFVLFVVEITIGITIRIKREQMQSQIFNPEPFCESPILTRTQRWPTDSLKKI